MSLLVSRFVRCLFRRDISAVTAGRGVVDPTTTSHNLLYRAPTYKGARLVSEYGVPKKLKDPSTDPHLIELGVLSFPCKAVGAETMTTLQVRNKGARRATGVLSETSKYPA
eukprot:5797972-Pyramimonas_sp.AAC.2